MQHPAARSTLFITLSLGLAGCNLIGQKGTATSPQAKTAAPMASATTASANTGKPAWFYNPAPEPGTLGGIGICGRHVRGPSGQREKAIQRAFDELAGQMGTKVDLSIEKTSTNNGSTGSIYSFQTTEGKVVKARLRAQWIDPQTDELYLWMTVP